MNGVPKTAQKGRGGKPKPPAPSSEEAQDLTGTVQSIVFRAEDTGYTVCRLKLPDKRDPIVVVGNTAAVWEGETLKATGKWVRHPRHGLQFQAESLLCIAPTSLKGIERYLSSGLIKGIRKVMAQRMVERFGMDTLKVIQKDSKRLEEVEGIGPVRRKLIKESWIEQKAVRDIMIFLQSHGVGTAQAARIYRQYGNDAISVITENPYTLCRDVWGIGFKTADGVAMSLGVPKESAMRARAGAIHVLGTMADEGHCFCNEVELVLQAQSLLDIPAEVLQEAVNREVESGRLIRDERRIYLTGLHTAEIQIAAKLHSIVHTDAGFKPINTDRAVEWAEHRMNMRFAQGQTSALKTALSNKVSIITGGPGVGKTTIIRALVDVFETRKLRVALAAPTGRAAKRMEEATRHEAKTIHRMLKFTPVTGSFERGFDDPMEEDIFILDEVSMIDVPLMNAFLAAVPDKGCVVLVGDMDQLPSVGPGNVLRDLIESEAIPTVQLETIFRQESGGWIVQNAHRVNRGEWIEQPPRSDDSDFFFIECADPDDAVHKMLNLVTSRIPARFGFDPTSGIQVLTPMRKGQLGAENLNSVLQEQINPRGPAVSRFGREYRLGDRIMQIRNNYDKEVFNGDIGIVRKVDLELQSVEVDFDGKIVPYDVAELDELVHAYACSIHKSQGSEYPAVVILMTTQHFKLLQRNLLYTAITRGRKLVCLVGSSKAVRMAIRNNEIKLRRTGLGKRVREMLMNTERNTQ